MEASFKRIALLHSHSQLPVIDSRAMGGLDELKTSSRRAPEGTPRGRATGLAAQGREWVRAAFCSIELRIMDNGQSVPPAS